LSVLPKHRRQHFSPFLQLLDPTLSLSIAHDCVIDRCFPNWLLGLECFLLSSQKSLFVQVRPMMVSLPSTYNAVTRRRRTLAFHKPKQS
jgi:hypothetical protein